MLVRSLVNNLFLSAAIFCCGCSGPIFRSLPLLGVDYATPRIEKVPSSTSPEFKVLLSSILGTPFTEGNQIDTYVNGDQIFPAMLSAIKRAKESVILESYIFWDGTVPTEFVGALCDRAKHGVQVQILLDWHGSQQGSARDVRALKDAGADVRSFHPLSWFNPLQWKSIGKLDNRTHRRILVIDGSVAFTGGVGIADEWKGDARNSDEWRDTHFKIRGPAVSYISGVFAENWWSAEGTVNSTLFDGKVDKTVIRGTSAIQVSRSAPGDSAPAGITTFILALQAARKSIRISTPYFVPEGEVLEQLTAAAKRGVKLEIIVPGKQNDKQSLRSASRGLWGDLLKAGTEIYEFQTSLYHTKLLIVDDTFVTIGTTNWDSRSLRYNNEIIVNVLDPQFAQQQIEQFEKDKSVCDHIKLSDWESRSWLEKGVDWLAGNGKGEM